MKAIERILMGLAVVALVCCWSGLLGCTAICALQWNRYDKGKDRYTLPPEPVAPDGQVRQRNRMVINVSAAPDLNVEMPSVTAVPSVTPDVELGKTTETSADVEKGSGDKNKVTTRPAAEAARGVGSNTE